MSAAELTVDPSDPTPPYEQLRRQLVELIATGRLAGGDRLPPVRQLAGDLGLANGTVARTYRELESSGHLVTSRGAGTRVAKDIRPSPAVELLREHAETYALRARALGVGKADALAAVTAAFGHPPSASNEADRRGAN